MRFSRTFFPSLLLLGAGAAKAASWSFDDAIISVTGKGSPSSAFKDKLSDHVPLASPVKLGSAETLKIVLTAIADGTPKRPHQAFLLLRDQDTGLETAFSFSVKQSGKGKVNFTQKDLPIQLLTSSQPLRATLLLASFGSTKSFSNHVFNLDVQTDNNARKSSYEKPLRYGRQPEIHHIFKADPKSAPLVVSLFFFIIILATIPALFGTWTYLGANLAHLSKALGAAPIAHIAFFGSIISTEGTFILYYYNWNLFQVLPIAGALSLIIFLSGSKALSEVQSRCLAGER